MVLRSCTPAWPDLNPPGLSRPTQSTSRCGRVEMDVDCCTVRVAGRLVGCDGLVRDLLTQTAT